jgi:hypothetical protein
LQGFKDEAKKFGGPAFLEESCYKGYLALFKEKERDRPRAVVAMIRELRFVMKTLSSHPVEVDTGQYRPKKQDRTYADMENEIAMRLTQQRNFQAKVKMLSGEADIKTKDLYVWRTGRELSARIAQIKALMRARGYTRHRTDVEKQIRERQERWKNGGGAAQSAGEPPPTRF